MNIFISEKQKVATLAIVGLLVFFVPLLFFSTKGATQGDERTLVEKEQVSESLAPFVISEKSTEETPNSTEDITDLVDVVIEIPTDTKVSSDDKITTNKDNTEVIGSSLPIRLTIPKSNVAAPVISVGVTADGAMDTPKGPNEVAWFNLGPRPGEVGSAVLSGHYGWKDNIPAVFDNLHTLQKGDKVYVEDGSGVTITFVVREVRTYGENADATAVFSSNDGKAHLNLITCGGIWNKDTKSYSERTVVFTDKVVE